MFGRLTWYIMECTCLDSPVQFSLRTARGSSKRNNRIVLRTTLGLREGKVCEPWSSCEGRATIRSIGFGQTGGYRLEVF